jgi:hypothetical protein
MLFSLDVPAGIMRHREKEGGRKATFAGVRRFQSSSPSRPS